MEQKIKCNENNTNNYLSNINSKYILTQIFDYIDENKYLNIIRYNKALQKKIDIDIKYYEKLSLIEIELYPINKAIKGNKDSNQTYFSIYYNKKKNKSNIYDNVTKKLWNNINKIQNFINIDFGNESHYHIFFNNDYNIEIKKSYFTDDDNITKINIKIDYEIKSLKRLFYNCKCIEKINFINFNRSNITNMSSLFESCSGLKEINFGKFKTKNVTDMSKMFYGCESLTNINLSSFNTKNVNDMSYMFRNCDSLTKIDLSNFNTEKVTNMGSMFQSCYSLKQIRFI